MRVAESRNYGVDSARSLAILGVLLVHAKVFEGGRFGVQLFFIISGYLLVDMGNQKISTFIYKRALRLFPLYLVIGVIFYHSYVHSVKDLIFSIFLLQNISWHFIQLPGTWSISNEWLYSLILPFIRKFGVRTLLALLGVSWFGQMICSLYVFLDQDVDKELGIWINTLNPFINLAFLLLGIGIRKSYIPVLRNKSIILITLIVTQITCYLIGRNLIFVWLFTLWAIFSLCIRYSPKGKLIRSFVQYIGKRTYGIFFIHFIVLDNLYRIEYFQSGSDGMVGRYFLLFLATLLISSLFAEITWRLIELPAIRLGAKLSSQAQQHR